MGGRAGDWRCILLLCRPVVAAACQAWHSLLLLLLLLGLVLLQLALLLLLALLLRPGRLLCLRQQLHSGWQCLWLCILGLLTAD